MLSKYGNTFLKHDSALRSGQKNCVTLKGCALTSLTVLDCFKETVLYVDERYGTAAMLNIIGLVLVIRQIIVTHFCIVCLWLLLDKATLPVNLYNNFTRDILQGNLCVYY